MIIYALVARGSLVLVEYTSHDGDYSSIARKILVKSQKNHNKTTLSKNEFAFTFFSQDEFTFLCISKTNASREKAHKFLDQLAKTFFSNHSKKDANSAQSWTAQFTKMIKELIVNCSIAS